MKHIRAFQLSFLTPAMAGVMSALYLLFSVGVLKSTHFCMGREISVVFFSADTEQCECTPALDESHGCCDDDHDVLRIKDSPKTLSALQLSAPELPMIGVVYEIKKLLNDKSRKRSSLLTCLTPSPSRDLYKIHCCFVFYEGRV